MAEPLAPPAPVTSHLETPGGQVLAPDRGADEAVYRPLSLLALAGFLVAAVFAVVMVIGGLTAFLKGSPLLGTVFATLAWLFPLVGGTLSAIAWFQIQRSEGTRAGTSLAVWGMRLCVLLGLGYWAYYAATRFAVCNQAEKFTTDWFATLAKGDPESLRAAFVLSQAPANRRGDDPKQRDQIEARYNVSENSLPGKFTQFSRTMVVRSLLQSGSEAKVEKLGVSDWAYEHGGYRVSQVFRITTPEGTFEVPISVHGSESRHKEFEGRQWYVLSEGLDQPKGLASPLGESHARLREDGGRFAAAWIARLRDHPRKVFLDTLDPAAAARLGDQTRQTLLLLAGSLFGVSGPAAVPLLDPRLIDRLQPPAYRDFLAGGVVHSGQFWSEKSTWLERLLLWARTTAAIKQRLQPPIQPQAITVTLDNALALLQREDGHVYLVHDLQMMLPPEIIVEGRLVLETDARAEQTGKAPYWRIVAVELDRVRAIPRHGPGGPGSP